MQIRCSTITILRTPNRQLVYIPIAGQDTGSQGVSVNFYHHFLPNAPCILQPLHKLLAATKSGSVKYQWSSEVTLAVMAANKALASTTMLVSLKPNDLTTFMWDASDTAVGALLQQYIGHQLISSPLSLVFKDIPLQMSNSTIVSNVSTDILTITCHLAIGTLCLTCCTHSHIRVYEQCNIWSQHDSCSLAMNSHIKIGHKHDYSVRD